jgi:hypothetical protein
MGNFLSASAIHEISRFSDDYLDPKITSSANQSTLDLIARISKDHCGALYEVNGTQVIYVFDEVELAVKAAISIQMELDFLNASNHTRPIHLASTGIVSQINPVNGALEEGHPYQIASFMSESAGAGELYLSEGAYDVLKNPTRLLCRFTRQLLKIGEDRALNAYEVFWKPTEVDLGKFNKLPNAMDSEIQPTRSYGFKLFSGIFLLFFGVLLLAIGYEVIWNWFIRMAHL